MISKAVEILRQVRERQRINNRRVRGCTCPDDIPPNAYAQGCPPHEAFERELWEMATRHRSDQPGGTSAEQPEPAL